MDKNIDCNIPEIPENNIKRMEYFMKIIRKKNDEHFEKTGERKKHLTVTYGCQMNEHDSEKILRMLNDMGYAETDKKEEADLIIFNTCCVRENAELKVYGNLGALKSAKKNKKNLIIAVCGCMMQQPKAVEEIKKKYRHVDLIFGTYNLYRFPELLANCMESDNMFIEVWDKEKEIVEKVYTNRDYEIKSFVNIMYGCNNFCSYCIVPYTRGRERSRELNDIINEVLNLAQNGTKEIILLGQNVNSYGKTLDSKINFATLLEELNQIEDIERIRFMTSHPKDLSNELINVMADSRKICEHLHLPFQAGSNNVLKRMNRNYTKEDYLNLIKEIKLNIPNIALTTDIIVGFPGETEDDFLDTLEIVERVRYDSAYTFLYSKREGTPAAKMDGQINKTTKHKRFDKLVETINNISADINNSYLGKRVEVLVEGPSKSNPKRQTGRTRQNKLVNFDGDNHLIGKLVEVKITEAKTFSLNGKIL